MADTRKSFNNMPDSQRLYFSPGGFTVQWSAKGVGFGSFTFRKSDGTLVIANELMTKGFIKEVLCRMVDGAVLEDPVEDALRALRGENQFKQYVNGEKA